MNPALFLDRDGIINRRRVDDYVKQWEEFEFLPDIFTLLPEAHAAGFVVVVVTNQRGIARGLMTEQNLADIHRQMQQELQKQTGHQVDAIYHCPHNRADGCDCRKPNPGMLLRAAADHNIALANSWLVGDSESDVQAGLAAGCRAVLVDPTNPTTIAESVTATLSAAWEYINTHTIGGQQQNAIPSKHQ
ncbi:MAG: HAD family hydrolase [Armatimonadetes bacterium]|nr:HAD family hydrolase [Armatimonadota bacterium]